MIKNHLQILHEIEVLQPVYHTNDDELHQRLELISQTKNVAKIFYIPYRVDALCSCAVIIKINLNGNPEKVVFDDLNNESDSAFVKVKQVTESKFENIEVFRVKHHYTKNMNDMIRSLVEILLCEAAIDTSIREIQVQSTTVINETPNHYASKIESGNSNAQDNGHVHYLPMGERDDYSRIHLHRFRSRQGRKSATSILRKQESSPISEYSFHPSLQLISSYIQERYRYFSIKGEKDLRIEISKLQTSVNQSRRTQAEIELDEKIIGLSHLKELASLVEYLNSFANNCVNLSFISFPCVPSNPNYEGPLGMSFIDLYEDYKSLPIGFEKHVLNLICSIYYRLREPLPRKRLVDLIELESTEIILKKVDEIMIRLGIELLECNRVRNGLETIKVYCRDQKWIDVLMILEKIWKSVCVLNFNELFRLIEKAESSITPLDGKCVILFVGIDRVAKSTAIKVFSNSKMFIDNKSKLILNHIENGDQPNRTTNNVNQSQSLGDVDTNLCEKNVSELNRNKFVLCDCPDFHENIEPEHDIAQEIAMMKVFRSCSGVNPVIVISYLNPHTQLIDLKKLVVSLTRIIPDIETHVKTFSYVFICSSDVDNNDMKRILTDLGKQLDKDDPVAITLKHLLDDMIMKMNNWTILSRACYDEERSIPAEISLSETILDPTNVFKYTIAERTKASIQEQMRKHKSSIMNTIKYGEYELLTYKLDQMKRFIEFFKQDFITENYTESIVFINNYLSKRFEANCDSMNISVSNSSILTDDHVLEYKKAYRNAVAIEKLGLNQSSSELMYSHKYTSFLDTYIDSILNTIKFSKLDDAFLKVCVENLKTISRHFQLIAGPKYILGCRFLNEKLLSTFKCFIQNDAEYSLEEDDQFLSWIQHVFESLSDHIDPRAFCYWYSKSEQVSLGKLKGFINSTTSMLLKEALSEDDVRYLDQCVALIRSKTTTTGSYSYILKQSYDEILEQLLIKIRNYFEKIVENVSIMIVDKVDFRILEKKVIQLCLIKNISAIESLVADSFSRILQKVLLNIENFGEYVKNCFELFYQKGDKTSYEKFLESLETFKNTEWIKLHHASIYRNIATSIKCTILDIAEEILRSLASMSEIDDTNEMETKCYVLFSLNQTKQLDRYLPGIKAAIEKSVLEFQEIVDKNCEMIIISFEEKNYKSEETNVFDWESVEIALQYVAKCRKINLLSQKKVSFAQNSVGDAVQYRLYYLKERIFGAFETIKDCSEESQVDFVELGKILSKYFREVLRIKDSYRYAFSYFKNHKFLPQLSQELVAFRLELKEKMEELLLTRQIAALNHRINVAKTLSKVDVILEDTYIDLYKKYYRESNLLGKKIFNNVMNAMNDRDYEIISMEIVSLEILSNSNPYFCTKAKHFVNIDIEKLIEETEYYATMFKHEIDVQKLELLARNLNLVRKATSYLPEYLQHRNKLTSCFSISKNAIEYRINSLVENVQILLNGEHISQAEEYISMLLEVILTKLKSFISEDIYISVIEVNTIRSRIVLDEIPKRYSEMTLEQYMLKSPIVILNKLKSAGSINPIYISASRKIEEAVLLNFQKTLNKAVSFVSSDPNNHYFRLYASTLDFVPHGMKKLLEIDLKDARSQ